MAQHSLGNLGVGEVGIIDRITSTRGAAKRLADMGFVHGAMLEMVHPGAPCIVRLDSTCVGLGQAHQASILIDPA